MDLLEKITSFADPLGMLPPEGLIIAAVSGGADSMCLLAALKELSGTRGFAVAAAHFNHRLRGDESDGDEAFVNQFCLKSSIPLYLGSGDVRAYAEAHGLGIEAAARALRYAFLDRTGDEAGAVRIATAHTADDNGETLLLNLTRGTGLKGLGGIPPVRGKIVRPMLTITRREILEFLDRRSIPYREDSSNSLDIYSRNLIRHRVVPVLTELNPRFAENAATAAQLLREDENFLDGLAARYIAEHAENASLDARALASLPRPISSRVIRQLAAGAQAGGQLSAAHIGDILNLCASDTPSGQLSLPGCTVFREYGRIVFSGSGTDCSPGGDGFRPIELPIGGRAEIPELGLSVSSRLSGNVEPVGEHIAFNFEKINKSFTTFLFKYDNVCGKITIRPRKTGDKIKLFGGNGTKTLKKLFIEKHIPARQRAMIPVIADDAGVLAVCGIGCGVRAAVDSQSAEKAGDTTLEIKFEETVHEK